MQGRKCEFPHDRASQLNLIFFFFFGEATGFLFPFVHKVNVFDLCNLVKHGIFMQIYHEKHGAKLVRMKIGTGFVRWQKTTLMVDVENTTPVLKICSHMITGMGGNDTVQGIFGHMLHIPQYWLEVAVSFLGFLILDNLVWSWKTSTCSKLGQVSFKEAVLPQNFVSSTQFIFAFSLKLSGLTTFVLFFRMVSSPVQLKQWTMLFLFCGC